MWCRCYTVRAVSTSIRASTTKVWILSLFFGVFRARAWAAAWGSGDGRLLERSAKSGEGTPWREGRSFGSPASDEAGRALSLVRRVPHTGHQAAALASEGDGSPRRDRGPSYPRDTVLEPLALEVGLALALHGARQQRIFGRRGAGDRCGQCFCAPDLWPALMRV